MARFLFRIWFFIGAVGLIIVTTFFIVIVRVVKLFMGKTASIKPAPEADIFLDSRKQPLTPILKNTTSDSEK